MDSRLQLRVQRYGWDAAASHYHGGWEDQLRPAHDTLMAMSDAKRGDRVVEAACGSGIVTMRLADIVGPTGRVFATDLSDGMLQTFRSRLDTRKHSHIELGRMPVEQLELPDDAFDHAVCALGLMYTPRPDIAVRELARVTRPGGTVTVSVWGERRNCGWAEVFPIVDARVASDVCPLFFATGAQGALVRICQTVGLEAVREHRQLTTLSYPSEQELVRAVFHGGPVALAVKRFSNPVWNQARTEFLASVAAYRAAGGGYEIPAEFVTATARVPSRSSQSEK